MKLFDSYSLRTAEAELARQPAEAISGLRLLDGFQCLTCSAVPWLDRRAGIAECIRGLGKDQNQAAFALPTKGGESEPELVRILEAMDEVLAETTGWCADGPEYMPIALLFQSKSYDGDPLYHLLITKKIGNLGRHTKELGLYHWQGRKAISTGCLRRGEPFNLNDH